MVNRKIVNIFQPDVMYLGGLTKALKVANFIKNGGLFIADHTEYDLGDEVFIHLNLIGESEKIRIEGKVIWVANEGVKSPHRPGVGIQFSESEHLANDKIETYLAGSLSSSEPTLTM